MTSTLKNVVGQWGNWQLIKQVRVLKHVRCFYEIDLDRCQTSADLLDWIFHVRGKFNDQDNLDLMQAFEDVLHPRANLCGWGTDKRADVKSLVKNFGKRDA